MDYSGVDFADGVSKAINRAVLEYLSDKKEVAIAYSGGLDSTIIAHLCKQHVLTHLYTVGFPDSHDVKAARKGATLLNLPLKEIILTENTMKNNISMVVRLIANTNPVQVTISLPLFFVACEAVEGIVMSGQGADELFGGYARYQKETDKKKLAKLMEDEVQQLLDIGVERDKMICSYFGKEAYHPFLASVVVGAGLSVPIEEKIQGEARKVVLRKAAGLMGVPDELISVEKKAAQYGSGIMKRLRKMAKQKELHTEEYIRSLL